MKTSKKAGSYNKTSGNSDRQINSSRIERLVPLVVEPSVKYQLPASLTPFVERPAEIEAVCELLNQPVVRLVTLYGTAGIGKTRLSLVIGKKLKDKFGNGVYFVDLATLTKPEAGLASIAQTLGLKDQPHLPLFENLKNYLQKRELLLILDNFEQIVGLGKFIAELLEAAPRLKVLVTSRILLRIYGEHVFSVPTLTLPDLNPETEFEILCQNQAVSLFSQCARMVNSEFRLTAENIGAVAQLCVYLEGLPLAIELAAARCNLFSPQTLLARLTDPANTRFEFLVDGFSNLPPRQQTLTNAVEWSYALLSEPEKQLFRRLGIFVTGFSLEAAEAIDLTNKTTLETLISLLNKSLLKRVESEASEDLRFTMLETLREFALNKLSEMGELTAMQAAHSHYFMETVETNTKLLKQIVHLKRLSADHPNILNALEYLIESQEVVKAFRLGGSIWKAWWRWGYLSEGRQWLNKILTLPGAEIGDTLRAQVLEGAAYLAMYQSDYPTAKICFEQALAVWREREPGLALGAVISGLAGTHRFLGNYELALKLNYECLALYRRLGSESNIADSLCNTAWQLLERGNYESVQNMLEESLALHTKANYLSGMGRAKIYLGDFLWRMNKPAEAIQHLEEAMSLLKQFNHQIRIPTLLYRLGLIYLCQEELDMAQKYLEESVRTAEEMYTPLDLTYAYSCLGLFRLVQHNLVEAQTLFEKAISHRSKVGQPEGIMWGMEGLAVIALEQNNPDLAQEMIAQAQIIREAISAPLLPHTLKFIQPKLLNLPKPEAKTSTPVKDTAVAHQKFVSVVTEPVVSLEHISELSEREKEVLQLVAQGYRNAQIAQQLIITPGTVNNHLTSIYSKLGVNSRTAAVRFALDHHLLQA